MGYACPVCEVPQQDGHHLANHLAFTALLRGGDHETWLADHVPDWEACDPETLAERVTELADSAEYDAVFEDTTDEDRPPVQQDAPHDHAGHSHARHDHGGHDHARQGGAGHSHGAHGGSGVGGPAAGADDLRSVVSEARELTRQMYEGSGDGDETGGADDSPDGDSATTTKLDDSPNDGDRTADGNRTTDDSPADTDHTADDSPDDTDHSLEDDRETPTDAGDTEDSE